ncbi:prolactin-inducible protein [Perognathus longimembris pacificus]|uniref:prolactin-inducible protein n=1 Tax=Perognathus longimembris pacificus TaxID=214514 RepID=UPI00201958E6|nr:prolactin-inducible protein [Perognathus longimembris pacificus]
MSRLQLLLRASPAALLLILCLQLGISDAQENTTNRKAIIFSLERPQTAKQGEEVTVALRLKTELRECMVIKAYLISDIAFEGQFNYKYTRCLCEDSPVTYFWDFTVNRTATIRVIVDIVREKGICPEDLAVVPISANRYYQTFSLYVA